jgi:molecular chaperone GrpE
MKQFGDVLKAHNVEEIKTAGEKFDPKFHEAVGEEEDEKFESGSVIRELQSGYVMGGRVVKTAKVIIAK